jgi:hypothetical protein
MNLNMRTVIDHLLVDDRAKGGAHRQLDLLVDNLVALGILDEHGRQVAGEMIRDVRGIDSLFVYHCLVHHDLGYEELRELCEFLVDHVTIHRILTRKDDEKRRDWIGDRLRERRREEPQVSWEDVEAEYEKTFPRELSKIETLHQAFVSGLPHPELHGGKIHKTIWKTIEDGDLTFMDFAERHDLAREEGNLFSYLARVMKVARMLHEATQIETFKEIERRIRARLATVDERVIEDLWEG